MGAEGYLALFFELTVVENSYSDLTQRQLRQVVMAEAEEEWKGCRSSMIF